MIVVAREGIVMSSDAIGGFRAALAMVLAALAAACLAIGPVRAAPSTPMGIPLAPKPGAWLTARWTGDSAAFAAADRDVKRRCRTPGFQEAACRAAYGRERAAALAAPLDLLPAYRWLVASTQVAYFSGVVDRDALDAVARLDPGTFRQVARTRVAALIGPSPEADAPHPALAGLEGRLLRADPADLWLREHAIRDLANGRATQPQALALADGWVRESPASAQAHGVLAHVALLRWFASGQRDRPAAQRAVAEYGQYLRLAPPDAPGRVGARDMADRVRQAAGLGPTAR